MSNPFFAAMGGGTPGIMQMVKQLRANPLQFLAQRRMNIPQNMTADPNAIINHLLSTGQVTQDQLNRAYQMARNFRR